MTSFLNFPFSLSSYVCYIIVKTAQRIKAAVLVKRERERDIYLYICVLKIHKPQLVLLHLFIRVFSLIPATSRNHAYTYIHHRADFDALTNK